MHNPSAQEEKKEFPWWLLIIGGVACLITYKIFRDDIYREIFSLVSRGIIITILVTIIAFLSAMIFGLILATASLSKYVVFRQSARLYIEVMRGIPILVMLFYVAFVGAPLLVQALNFIFEPFGMEPISTRAFSFFWRAVIALVLSYSAYIAEIFRAGILAVDAGQIEAGKALGLKPWHRFRHIIWPQAFRVILPPLGNDFIALIKDSSLVSVLGVADITQLGKIYASGNFRYFETYNMVAFIYLLLTLGLSLLLRALEKRLKAKSERV